jgi:RloB-like protein
MPKHFTRPVGQRPYKRLFIIIAEGTVTEQEYFKLLDDDSVVRVKCLDNTKNLPPDRAPQRAKAYVKSEGLKKGDQAWVVIDKDSWPEEHLRELHRWAQSKPEYGFALSNPKFEYWLLLHFDDPKGITTGPQCEASLARKLPNYDKHINRRDFDLQKIQQAVARAKTRDTPPCADWPRQPGTTVYRLVEAIFAASSR